MIQFDHVSKVYPNGTVGLDDVNLTIRDGEFVAIIGRSGAGKSTLLRSVNRMHRITSGTLTVNGINVSTLSGKSLRRFRRGIGMVFQSFNLVTRTTVIKNVLSACVPDMPFWRGLLGIFRREDKMKALESLDKVGILDKAYIRADQLSGGQQQRVALARTLTQDPQIILPMNRSPRWIPSPPVRSCRILSASIRKWASPFCSISTMWSSLLSTPTASLASGPGASSTMAPPSRWIRPS